MRRKKSKRNMIETLHIQNYRLFKDLTIAKLGQVNLIAGQNNSGKTALLEAIRIFANNMNVNIMANVIYLRKEYDDSKKAESFATLFGSSEIIDLGENFSFKFNERGWGMVVLKNGNIRTHKGNSNAFAGQLAGMDSFNYKNPLDEVVYVPFLSDNQFRIRNNFWEKIVFNEDEKQKVVEILNIISQKQIKQFTVIGDTPMVLLENGQSEKLTSWGDGGNRLLMLGLALVNAKGKMLLIDEFEVGLHYSIQEKLWNVLFAYAKKWNIQVFVTTHSEDTIRAFTTIANKTEYEGMANYLRLQRTRNQQDIVAVVNDVRSLEIALHQEIEIR